jgi:hypothetical protein
VTAVELSHPPPNPINWMVVVGGVEFISEPRRTAFFAAASIRTKEGTPAFSECEAVMPLEEWRTKMTTSLQIHNNGPRAVKVTPVAVGADGKKTDLTGAYLVEPAQACPTVYVHGGQELRIEEISETKPKIAETEPSPKATEE